MDRRTLKALVASINQWRENAAAPAEEALTDPEHCPLCELFLEDRCSGCPVSNAVDDIGCRDTPYEDAVAARDAARQSGDEADQEAWRAAARAEVEFLESLLPQHGRVVEHSRDAFDEPDDLD